MTDQYRELMRETNRLANELERSTLLQERSAAEREAAVARARAAEQAIEGLQRKLVDARTRPLSQLGMALNARLHYFLSSRGKLFSKRKRDRWLKKAQSRDPARVEPLPTPKVPKPHTTGADPAPERVDPELARAMELTEQGGFSNAAAEIAALAERTDLRDVRWPVFRRDRNRPVRLAHIVRPRSIAEPGAAVDLSRVVVYTTLFGTGDDLPPVNCAGSGLTYLCFTDQDIAPRGWTIVKCDGMDGDGNLASKRYKLRPHLYLQDYDASLFVDANTVLWGRMDSLVARWLWRERFAMWAHPEHADIVEEAWAIVRLGKAALAPVAAQIVDYETQGVDTAIGHYEASCIWRRHNDPEMIAMGEAWWREVTTRTRRDQLSLGFAAAQAGVFPSELPECLGDSRKNAFFTKTPHRPLRAAGLRTPERRRVAFVYDEDAKEFGSTRMRVFQLAEILRAQLGGLVDIEVTADIDNLRGALVILHKRAIERLAPEQVQALRRRNDAVFIDPVDMAVEKVKRVESDGVLACSLAAYRRFRFQPEIGHVHLLTHHADPRLQRLQDDPGCARIGYFGELANTRLPGQFGDLIGVHPVDTRSGDDGWLREMGRYNVHYAVRQHRKIDGDKPFTKGFTAARVGALVICDRDQGDNLYYLGDDYPFYVEKAADTASLLASCLHLSEAYGTSEWRYAAEIMRSVAERSSDAWIAGEFRSLLREIYGL